MRVPPPYVPPLSSHMPDYGQTGRAPEPSATVAGDPEPEATTTNPSRSSWSTRLGFFAQLSGQERILSALLLISLILVPALMPRSSLDAQMLAPGDTKLQSIERAEENFAGSAFYFIDPDYAVPKNDNGTGFDPLADPGTGTGAFLSDGIGYGRDHVFPAHRIRPIAFRASATDNSRAQYCLSQAIYYEAGMEPDAGQRAVAQVILNRVRHPSYPGTVCGVIYQGSERATGCQFTYTCDGSLRRKPDRFHWNRARKVANEALTGKSYTTVGTATHYHATYVYPYWAPGLRFLGTVGAHRFYSWKGSAGRAEAFNQAYRGGEPLPAPKPRRYNVADNGQISSPLDPIALEKAYEESRRIAELAESQNRALSVDIARRHDQPVPTPDISGPALYKAPNYSAEAKAKGGDKAYAGQRLPEVSQVKAEFRDSGSWKKKPGS